MPMPQPLYRLHAVTRTFRLEGGEITVLKGLTLDIPEGGWYALVGRSGCGKTTLLQLLGGLDRPTSGSILFRGEEMTRMGNARLTALRRKEFGFVFQSYHLLPELSALENAAMPALRWGDDRNASFTRAKALLCKFGLEARLSHRPPELSGGEQQRIAIARALLNDPPVLLADEPTGNLDALSAAQVVKIFQDLRKEGKTIVMVTHDQAIAKLADRQFSLG